MRRIPPRSVPLHLLLPPFSPFLLPLSRSLARSLLSGPLLYSLLVNLVMSWNAVFHFQAGWAQATPVRARAFSKSSCENNEQGRAESEPIIRVWRVPACEGGHWSTGCSACEALAVVFASASRCRPSVCLFSRCFPVPTCSCRQCSIALPVAFYVVRFPKFFTTTDGQIVQITSSRHNGGIWSLQPDSQPPGHILVWNTLLRRELADEVCHRSPTSSREIFRLPSLFRFLNSLCCALRALAKTPWVHHTLPLVLSSRELRRILTSHESSPRKSCPSGISFSPTRWSPFASPLCMRR